MGHRKFAYSGVLLAITLLAFAWQQEGWKTPPVMKHDAAGRENCVMCHQEGGPKPSPANHAEFTNDNCMACHAADATVQTTAPKAIAHELEGRDNCLMCHQAGGMKPVPADHEGRDNEFCQACHKKA